MTTVESLADDLREEFLTCSLCFSRFHKPKLLPCQHTFCSPCLMKWINTKTAHYKIECPMCREETNLPHGGVHALPESFFVVGLMDFLDSRLQDSTDALRAGLFHQFGRKGNTDGQLYKPQGIVACQSGNILVSDCKNRIQAFSSVGKFLYKYSFDQLDKKFSPCCVAITKHLSSDQSERLLVSDVNNKQVMLCELSGNVVRHIGRDDLQMPGGIAVTSDGIIHVVDVYANLIRSYTVHGVAVRTFGGSGAREGSFQTPKYIAVAKNDRLVVSDSLNHRIQIFDSTGHFRRAIGTRSKDNGGFKSPTGVAVDSNNNILIADGENHSLQLFDPFGRLLKRIDDDIDDLAHPESVTIGIDGSVLVADAGNHSVKVFRY
ncbi:tripartite motif-containing protein 2-like [Anneissia japonica]|uniref:tripartite motif-containing protein 2-like n=1 Tax=Anneissia japonica TaxID=1529436 RepID=UPI001425918A|nr:tripartite motif-containing protein 2-like [Anneissia japonica]